MDSITQLTLGAAVGEAVLGRKVGNRALFWGAICATLPDLDVFIPLGDAVSDFTYHRGYSHSLFVLAMVSPILAFFIRKLNPAYADLKSGWWWLVFWSLITHPLLDCFTVYGTQIFLPFSNYPVSGSAIFIIDPAYTLPLLCGVIAALLFSRSQKIGHFANTAALIVSSLYLAWVVTIKNHVEEVAIQSLKDQGLITTQLLSTPAPFNSFLWRFVAMGDKVYYEGYYSIFDQKKSVEFKKYSSQTGLLNNLSDQWAIKRLSWFSHGFFSVTESNSKIIITDLRMGIEPDYVFRFIVAKRQENEIIPTPNQAVKEPRNYDRVKWVWDRIWNESA
ncbi:MAG: inner membrane protein [Parasphingorhabdus sp.]|jgi:inner membrane protein